MGALQRRSINVNGGAGTKPGKTADEMNDVVRA